MKYIPKEFKNEPQCLRDYRLTEGAKYKTITGLSEALLKEQGAICAYCMRRISTDLKKYSQKTFIPQVGVEHIVSQESDKGKQLDKDKQKGKQLDLDYHNLVAVCNGVFGKLNHCDKTVGGKMDGKVSLEKLYPTNPDCEKLIHYNSNGLIKSKNNDVLVEEDLLKLNLNDEKLKGYRRNTIDIARERLKQIKRTTTWTPSDFQKQIEFWSSKNDKDMYQPFCQIAIWYLMNEATKRNLKIQ